MLNCKAGDLAVIVKSDYGNLGKIVRVIEPCSSNSIPVGKEFFILGESWIKTCEVGFVWIVESQGMPIAASNGRSFMIRPVPDSALRPLRDTDGVDETLREKSLIPTEKYAK